MKNADKTTSKASLQSLAPRQYSEEATLENCPLCMEPILSSDLRCHLRDHDQTDYTPAHTACQDKATAKKREVAASKPKKFIG